MQVYAIIRKESTYRHQQAMDANKKPIPFTVSIDFAGDPFWPVKGGVGGQYTLFDVDLWVEYDGTLEKLPIHSAL